MIRPSAACIAPARSVLWALALCTLSVCSASAAEPPRASSGSQWLSFNNGLDGQRFSPLQQITVANAAQIAEVCRVQIDGPTSFTAGLVVVDDVIYTNTATETVALDARTCAVRWKHSYTPEEARSSASSRGLAVLDGRVFRGTGDARLIALDAATGKLLWKNVIGTARLGESASAAPLAWQGVVYMGIGGSEFGIRGRVMAFDAQTGRELWRFNTVPMGKERGAETWKRPQSAKTGGGGVWGAMTLDVTTGELFVPVGNPWPDIDKAYRPGDNLFTNSLVVLDAHSGELKWWHQVTPADWQDLDLTAAPVIYRDSKIRDVVAFAGKDGYVTALDRDTRQRLFHTPVTTIATAQKGATPEGVRVCPGFAGGVQWNGPTLDTQNNTLVTGSVDVCFILKSGATQYTPGEVSFGGTVEPDGPVTGWVTALDSESGEIRWRYHAEKPVIAGVTPTAGGVTFTGDLAGNLLVLNSKTGELLHKQQTGGALAGGVVTYESAGTQFVAFASGNVSRTAFGALGLPSVVITALKSERTAAPQTRKAVTANGPAGAPNVANGQRLYTQVCTSCHGPDGNLIADHKLNNLKSQRDLPATIEFIKNPKLPMPKLYPDLLNEQSVVDVANYLHQGLGR